MLINAFVGGMIGLERAIVPLLAEEEARREALRTEAREIDRRFEEDERRLTELRDTTPPEEFRALADAFDQRVVQARREQDERSNALVMEFDRRRRQFYGDVAPLLVDILSRYGAHAIFNESTVLLADQSLNITDAVITITDRQQQLSGTLQDASGRAATDYTMILFPADRAYWLPDSRRIITARPGTDGRFAFLALQGPPAGEYMIAAVTDLRPSEQFDPDFLAALLPQAFKVTLGPGETKTQDVRLVKVP